MFCRKCGKEVPKDSKFCPACGELQEVVQEVSVVKKEEVANNHLANVLCSISLGLYFGMPLLSFIMYILAYGFSYNDSASTIAGLFGSVISIISSLSTIAAYVLMIIARVKCPKSTYAKVVMWIYIVLFAMSLITLIVIIFACAGAVAACANSY